MTQLLDRLIVRYADVPAIRALVELVPEGVGGALNELVAHRIEEIDNDRLDTLFHELSQGKRQLTRETIESEDFLHCYFATIRAVRITRQRQKIRYFGRLLASSYPSAGSAECADRFERYLGILEELTFEELRLLAIVAKHEQASTPAGNPFQNVCAYWEGLMKDAIDSLGLPRALIESLLARLERTGLYQPVAKVWVSGDVPRRTLTPLYAELSAVVALRTL